MKNNSTKEKEKENTKHITKIKYKLELGMASISLNDYSNASRERNYIRQNIH